MKCSDILYQDELAGRLWEDKQGTFHFQYTLDFLASGKPPVTPNLPKQQASFSSPHLFPVFYNMLTEGDLRKLQERTFKIDPRDHFGLLRATAKYDTIGAITVRDSIVAHAE